MENKLFELEYFVFILSICLFVPSVMAQNSSYTNLQNQIATLENKLDTQTSQINDLRSQINALNSRLGDQTRQINDLRTHIDYQQSLIRHNFDKTSQLERSLQDLRNFTTPRPIR